MHPKVRGRLSREITYASEATVPPLAPSRQEVRPHAKKIMQEYDSSKKGKKRLERKRTYMITY
jgi:hypothetical protein